jgi:hypothetical protein
MSVYDDQMIKAGYKQVRQTETSEQDLIRGGVKPDDAKMLITKKGENGAGGKRVLISRSYQMPSARGAVAGAVAGAALGGVARKVMPRAKKVFDTRLKNGAMLKPKIRKTLSDYYK